MTIGHSTRSLDELVDLLRHHRVELLVDVRTLPASRRMPHFARSALERSLPEHGIAYRHMPELGGLRKPKPDSTNLGWRNVSFRGYADYMQTDAFRDALAELEGLAATKRIAAMCAEAVPWRCHRSLIADALVVDGVEVRHIIGMQEPSRHRMTPFARVVGGKVTYPPPDTLPL
ncbi:MAG TPA: DUF488 domain-containing protein [Candidatus Dormibacteraeota bacterium]|nr:DUF488 domain-containing protein [Candidatus Dormibacteraeota bacterium]